MPTKLTNQTISKAVADKVSRTVVDTDSPLQLRVTATGTASFRVRLSGGGKKRSVTLGRVGELSLTEARQLARDLLAQHRLRDSGLLVATPEPTPVATKTVQQASDEWRAAQTKARQTTREKHELACRHITDSIGEMLVSAVTRSLVVTLLDDYRDRPCSHNEIISIGDRIWNRCLLRGDLPNEAINPWLGIPKLEERSRETVLPVPTLLAIWEEAGHPRWGNSGLLFRFMLASGCRRGEARHATFGMVDRDEGLITIPGEFTKTGKPTVLTITPLLDTVLDDIYRLQKFHHPENRLMPGARGGLVRTDNRHRAFSEAVGVDPAEWRCHDFRRSIVTCLVDDDLCDAVSADAMLGHSPSSLSSVAKVYNRSTLRKQAAVAAHAWSTFFMARLEGPRRQTPKLRIV